MIIDRPVIPLDHGQYSYNGYLSPEGLCYECPWAMHIFLVAALNDINEDLEMREDCYKAEKRMIAEGWIKLHQRQWDCFTNEPTAKQIAYIMDYCDAQKLTYPDFIFTN